MRRVAAFASSEQGRNYAQVCHYWGVDPGAMFEDDVLAHNLRAALIVTLADKPEPEPLKLAERG